MLRFLAPMRIVVSLFSARCVQVSMLWTSLQSPLYRVSMLLGASLMAGVSTERMLMTKHD